MDMAQSIQQNGVWKCTRCNYVNFPQAEICEMCDLAKSNAIHHPKHNQTPLPIHHPPKPTHSISLLDDPLNFQQQFQNPQFPLPQSLPPKSNLNGNSNDDDYPFNIDSKLDPNQTSLNVFTPMKFGDDHHYGFGQSD